MMRNKLDVFVARITVALRCTDVAFTHKCRCLQHSSLKAAKDEIQKPSTCRATLFHCKFCSMFRVFHLAWSTWPATKTFVAGWRNAGRWLVDLLVHEHICCATSCELDEKRATKPKFVAQSRPVLYFSQQRSSTRNKCFCCATSWSCKVKNGRHRSKLATKQCCAPSLGFFESRISSPLGPVIRVTFFVQLVAQKCCMASWDDLWRVLPPSWATNFYVAKRRRRLYFCNMEIRGTNHLATWIRFLSLNKVHTAV